MAWQSLSVREGKRPPEGPYEGVPPHLTYPLRYWLEGVFGFRSKQGMQTDLMRLVASRVRIPLKYDLQSTRIMGQILGICEQNDDTFLDVIDVCLAVSPIARGRSNGLRELLVTAGSVWTVAPDNLSLQRKVDPTAATAFQLATTPSDSASGELVEAWGACFGRQPNPSDAWDHAIKAVEAILIPIVVPNQDKAQLGHVLGQLDRQGSQWQLLLEAQQGITPIETLVGMLRLMWPNPDRHSGPDHRVPTLAEAQAVGHLAVTIVQWARDGVLSKR